MQIFISQTPNTSSQFAMLATRWAAQVLGAAWSGFNSWVLWVSCKIPSLMSYCGIFPFLFGGWILWHQLMVVPTTWWQLKYFWNRKNPKNWGRWTHPILMSISFQMGWNQPATSKLVVWVWWFGFLGFCYERDCFSNSAIHHSELL